MKRILSSPYVMFPLGAALAMAGLVGLSLLRGNRLGVNTPFVVFLAALPLVAALYSSSQGVHARGGWWIVRWAGTTCIGLLTSIAVLLGSMIVIPPGAYEAYNYAHFNFASYESGAERRVRVGAKALDATLFTLEEQQVRLSDLWMERPIVLEFGSVT